MRKANRKKVISLIIAAVMVFSMLSLPMTQMVALSETPAAVIDSIELSVGGGTKTQMTLYKNGLYESEVDLTAGSNSYSVFVNDEEVSQISVVPDSAQRVYIRYNAFTKEAVDSVNNASEFKSKATWTGSLHNIAGAGLSEWAPNDEAGDLDYIGGGRYRKTFEFPELAGDVQIEYKVAFGGAWESGEGDLGADGGADNVTLTLPAGTDSITIYADYMEDENGKGILADSISQPFIEIFQNDATVLKPALTTTVSLIGEVRGNSGTWDIDEAGWEFTQITPTKYVYSTMLNAGTYAYKVVFDRTYWYDKIGGNKTVNVNQDGTNIVFLYDAETQEIYDSINNLNFISEILGYASAPVQSTVTTNPNGTTTFVMSHDNQDANIELVYAKRSDPSDITRITLLPVRSIAGAFADGFTSGSIFLGDEALDIIYYYLVDGVRMLDGINTVTVDGESYSVYQREEFTGRMITLPGTLQTVLGASSWSAGETRLSYEGGAIYKISFTDVPAGNYEYKIAVNGSWDENYGADGVAGGANIKITVGAVGTFDIYYNDITNRCVDTLNYQFIDAELIGTGIPGETKMEDKNFTGIYNATIDLTEGTYNNVKIIDKTNSEEHAIDEFTITENKSVTFYYDPVTGLYYCDASDQKINLTSVKYDTRDTDHKSIYGAVEQNQEVSFMLTSDDDITFARMYIRGPQNKTLEMESSPAADGRVKWTTTVSFDTFGQYTYFFAVGNGSDVKVYSDDDGNYGVGVLTELTNRLPYDLIIYKEGFETPDWMKDAVIYQIFPDRFYNADPSNDMAQIDARGERPYEFVGDWYTLPKNPDHYDNEDYPDTAFKGSTYWGTDMYGGDIKGITERIDYLKALGVNVIYLNPVFHSISNHRYDATDYKNIDPILGTMGDFTELVQIANDNDMKIVLDGVFNHVSDDSIYFDRYYKFLGQNGSIGAYPYWAYVYDYQKENGVTQAQAEEAAKIFFSEEYGVTDFIYVKWFEVFNTPLEDREYDYEPVQDGIGLRAGKDVYGYEGWWGYASMPVIKDTNGSEYQTPGVAQELIDGEDSVTKYWLREGSGGWRLDVANEVSDETWIHFRDSVKAVNEDNVIIGELWGDSTEYLLGDMYDSVMNYVFRNSILGYAKGGNASDAFTGLERIRERYPEEAFYAMMNLVGSHDTARLLSYLDGIPDSRNNQTIEQAYPTYEETSEIAKQRQYVVALLQMTYPGAPTIYYGDEMGMVGADDPDDRRGVIWGKGQEDLVKWYSGLAAIRHAYPTLRTGDINPVITSDERIMAYIRQDEEAQMLVAANNSGNDITVTFDVSSFLAGRLTDLLNSNSAYTVTNGKITAIVPAYRGIILSSEVKKTDVDFSNLAPAFDSAYTFLNPVKFIELTADNVNLNIGETVNIKVSYGPDEAVIGREITNWQSSDNTIASVDNNGTVTALTAGKVTIYAVNSQGVSGLIAFTIKDPGNPSPDPGPVDPGPVDPGPVDPEPVDPEPVDPEPKDPRPVDPKPGESESEPVESESVLLGRTNGSNRPLGKKVVRTGDTSTLVYIIIAMILSGGIIWIVCEKRKYKERS